MSKFMRTLSTTWLAALLLITLSTAMPASPALAAPLMTCTNMDSASQVALKVGQSACAPSRATSLWHIQDLTTGPHIGSGFAHLRLCTSKNPSHDYRYIRSICAQYQVTTDYWRTLAAPITQTINFASNMGYDSAVLRLDTPAVATDSPPAYYLVKNLQTSVVTKVFTNSLNQLSISGLSPSSSYNFSITAVNLDGIAGASQISHLLTTAVAPPSFSLSHASENAQTGSAVIGFTSTSSGGGGVNYSISPALPAGMSFNITTGALSGTPTSLTVSTTYTITARNNSGSSSQNFTLAVAASSVVAPVLAYQVGDIGPGGGRIFYAPGIAFTETGAPCGSHCLYMEWAPSTWNNSGGDPLLQWSSSIQTSSNANGTALGTGFANTIAMLTSNSATSYVADTSGAANAAHSYNGIGNTAGQWFLPSIDELVLLGNSSLASSGNFQSTSRYWSSTENSWNWYAQTYYVLGSVAGISKNYSPVYVRPIRVF